MFEGFKLDRVPCRQARAILGKVPHRAVLSFLTTAKLVHASTTCRKHSTVYLRHCAGTCQAHSSFTGDSGAERRVQAVKALAPPALRSRNRQAGAAQAIQARAAGAGAQVARNEPCRRCTPPGAAFTLNVE
jgi:hypothetical protein